MIGYLIGILTMKTDTGVLIETGGIGYEVMVPGNSHLFFEKEGAEVKVYTSMIVREDDISLYGFNDMTSLQLFKKLITVSGVGAKAALSILSAMSVDEIRKAIVFEDPTMLTRAQGIGKKTAQRIVLDLKDKLGNLTYSEGSGIELNTDYTGIEDNNPRAEALAALTALGYSRGEAAYALAAVKDNDLTTEAYIKQSLKKLF
jgi:holliday junction DNA helicase RuvA